MESALKKFVLFESEVESQQNMYKTRKLETTIWHVFDWPHHKVFWIFFHALQSSSHPSRLTVTQLFMHRDLMLVQSSRPTMKTNKADETSRKNASRIDFHTKAVTGKGMKGGKNVTNRIF